MLSTLQRRSINTFHNTRCCCSLLQSQNYGYPKQPIRSHISTSQPIKNRHFNFQPIRNQLSVYQPISFQLRTSSLSVSTTWSSIRCYSQSLNDGKDDQNVQKQRPKRITTFQKVRYMVDIFWAGCKALFRDVRLALKTRRKLGLYHVRDYSRLTREELRHLRQTRQDVVKTFPVALLFMVPFIGYTAPILAYFYPRQLLSQQFWHPDQKKEFVLEEYEKRSQYYLPLIKECGITAKEIVNKDLLNFCLKTIDGSYPENEELLHFENVFSQHEDFSLQKMPRYHLVKICKCWLIPTGWYLPRWYLINVLNKRILKLHEDDVLILRDGIDTLTPECIEQAVHVRGLDEASLNDESKKFWLKDWIELSSNVKGKDISFLAHSAVFKAANFEMLQQNSSKVVEQVESR